MGEILLFTCGATCTELEIFLAFICVALKYFCVTQIKVDEIVNGGVLCLWGHLHRIRKGPHKYKRVKQGTGAFC
jgi:hypothetical protein